MMEDSDDIKMSEKEELIKKDESEPFPTKIIMTLYFATIFSVVMVTSPYSYSPKMLEEFGVPNIKIGIYIGLLLTLFNIGALIFNTLVWGYVSDHIGIRTAFVSVCCCTSVSTLMFGLTTSVRWAFVARFLQGCSMGTWVIGVAIIVKTVPKKHLTTALGIISTSRSLGLCIGPSIGGLLTFPAEQYPSVFSEDSVFGRFKLLLPNALFGIVMAILMIFGYMVLPPDKHSSSKDVIKKDVFGYMKKVIKIKSVPTLLVVCFLLTSSIESFSELFPVFLATNKSHEGLGKTPKEIGLIIFPVAVVLIVFELAVLIRLPKIFTAKQLFVFFGFTFSIVIPFLPMSYYIKNSIWRNVYLAIYLTVAEICKATFWLTLSIVAVNTVPAEYQGTTTGLTFSMISLARMITPYLLGTLYSWSLGNIKGFHGNAGALGFPFNQYFAFIIISLLMIVTFVIMSRLPRKTTRKQDGK